MNAILKILVFLTVFTGALAQDDIERIPASNEEDSCSICLPDGNYNLYTHLVDSVNYEPMHNWFSSVGNSIQTFFVNQSKPVVAFGFTQGFSSDLFQLNKTNYTNINKNIDGGAGFGMSIHAGVINGIQVVYRNSSIKQEWNHNGYNEDLYGMRIEEWSSSKFNASTSSYGIRLEPNLSNKFRPYISYSIQEITMEWEKIGQYKYLDQTYWTYIYPHTINDNFTERMFGTELSIGATIPVYQFQCAQILADFRYTENFINRDSNTETIKINSGSRIDFGITIQFSQE